jgi:tRNA(fMet)-specific endonuclease VapC
VSRVLDTDVVSYLFKGDKRADAFDVHLVGELLVVSFMTVAELYRWALVRNWGEARRTRLQEHLRNFVVHPFDPRLCLQWAEVTHSAQRNGRPIGCGDAWIAATARMHSIPLVTNNVSDYSGIEGLTVLGPST